MKVALCLYGIVGGVSGKDGKGGDIDFRNCYQYYKNNIIEPNNADVFLHTWSIQHQDALQELYKPKKALYESQIAFPNPNYRLKSRWYSHNKSLDMMKKYSKKNNVEYDFVMMGRFDMMWFNKLNFSTLNKDRFYASYTNDYPWEKHGVRVETYNNNHVPGRILDLWFIASPDIMNATKKIYDIINNSPVSIDIHRFLWSFLYNGTMRVEHKFYRGDDYELYRWKLGNY